MHNFTPRAQQVLALARKEAARLNHQPVASGHLLLGMIKLGQGTAVNVLAGMIVGGLSELQKEVERVMPVQTEKVEDVRIPYDASVKRVLALAGKEARSLNHTYVGTEHLLLGLLINEGPIKNVLESQGVTLEQARINVLKDLDPNISPEVLTATGATSMSTLREITSDAIRYWERCRVVYNLALAVVVVIVFLEGLPMPWERLSGESILGLFVLAVTANVVFCSAYLPDFFLQLSTYRAAWRRHRWMLFVVGLTLAGIITRWMTMGLFGIHHG